MSVVGVHTFHKDELCRAVGARIDFSGGRRLRGLMNENKERWINIEEVAEYIGVSPVTVRYWLRSGKNLPGKRVGRQWRFRIKDIDDWIKSGKSNFDD